MKTHPLKPEPMTVFIVGLPNTGKTQVFNNLTGKYALVANYPYTTVEAKSATCVLNGREYKITDTPGFHSLYIHSEEELLIRDLIIREKPQILIQCIDTSQLKRSLYLTADLLELEIPMIISLNDIDETTRQEKTIDAAKLSHLLGIPVVETIATENRGTAELRRVFEKADKGINLVRYQPQIENNIHLIAELLPQESDYRRKAAVLILQHDPYILKTGSWIPAAVNRDQLKLKVQELKKQFSGLTNKSMNTSINKWVDMIAGRIMQSASRQPGSFRETAAKLCRYPLSGFPILIAILGICFFLVVHVAGAIESVLSGVIFDPLTAYLNLLLPDGFWQDLFTGEYGLLSLGIFNAIGTILPILSVFFLLFGLLEDIGYLPNAGILIKRVLNKIGLSGKSIMPLVLGFGCKTMATLTTKSIPSRKEKLIAIYLIAFAIPCSAQLGLNMAILGKTGVVSFFIATFFLMLVEIIAGAFLNRIIRDDQKTSFIQELPAFRLPNLKGLLKKTMYRMLWFLKESLPIFIIAAVVLYFVNLFGVLDHLKQFLAPVIVHWLGLPLEMVEALILTMVREEMAAGFILKLSEAGMLNYIQSIVAVVITTMFIPCFANIVAMFKEAGVKAGIIMTLGINISTFILAGILNWVLKFIIGG